MRLDFTYQPDSLKEINLLRELDAAQDTAGLRIDQVKPVSTGIIPVREKKNAVAVSSTAGFKAGTIRKQVKHDLLNNNPRYLEPRNDFVIALVPSFNEGIHLPERIIQPESHDWITLLLLVGLGLFATVRAVWDKYISSLLQSTVNQSTAVRMYQEKNSSLSQGAFMLDLLFYIISAVFLFQLLLYFNVDTVYRQFNLYLYCLGFVVFYFILKKWIYKIIGAIIEKKSETREFLYNSDNFKRVAGLILLPVVAIITFFPFHQEIIPVYAGVSSIALLYLLLVFRGFIILLKKQFSIFYLILYFCTLEILPLVLLFKVLM